MGDLFNRDGKNIKTIQAINGPYQVDGSSSFYMPRNIKRFPRTTEWNVKLNNSDVLQKFIKRWILTGYEPDNKKFDSTSNIFTMGSCFATNIANAIEERREKNNEENGYSMLLHTPSSVNNTFGIEQFFRWALTGEISEQSYWHEGDSSKWMPSSQQTEYKKWLKESDGFVFTFGLSEIWKDLETDKVFWRAIPSDLYNQNKLRYKFDLSTVDENTTNIKNLIDLIREHVGDVPIILTVSPVPLKATFRDISCISANSVSKAILMLAVDNVISSEHPNVFYWPSYEVFKELPPHVNDSSFDDTIRHPKSGVVRAVINTFFSTYFK